ncbi:MAG: hypothetical protein Q7S85_00575 [Rugosibacter sp.]|nr:hypothetical protein [Rugosibacter sp.]
MPENRSAAGREPQAAPVVRIHAKHTPAGWPRQSPDRVPSLLCQFHAPVRYANIQGRYSFTIQLEAPAVYWGRGGRCWAFLHDFASPDIDRLMGDCVAATMARRQPHCGA